MSPGELLRAARARHGISQERLAARAGTTQSAISRLERDQVSPSVETLSGLLELLGHQLRLDSERVDWGHDKSLLQEGLGPALRRDGAERVPRADAVGPPPGQAFDPRPILELLVEHDVDFVLIGGLAGAAHGSAFGTVDVDVTYSRATQNLERMAGALTAMDAKLRAHGQAADRPFQLDARLLANGTDFTFTTRFGDLNILGEPDGAPPYERLRAAAETLEIGSVRVPVTSLDHLIAMKTAAGRAKDKLMVSEYIDLVEEQARLEREG